VAWSSAALRYADVPLVISGEVIGTAFQPLVRAVGNYDEIVRIRDEEETM
jgi:hypothetical protein